MKKPNLHGGDNDGRMTVQMSKRGSRPISIY